MADLELVGDIDVLNDGQKEFIINVVRKRGFKNAQIDVQSFGKLGDNFAANVKRIVVEEDGVAFKMIAKVAPRSEMLRMVAHIRRGFLSEHILYREVLPKFTELEKAANIPEEERLRYTACYGTYLEAPNELILLEDLAISGFTMLNKNVSLTDKTVRLVLKNFAMLHSLSYALKHQEPDTFQRICKSIPSVWAITGARPELSGYFHKIDDDAQLLLDDDKYKKAVKNVTAQTVENAMKLAEIDIGSKHSVI